MAKTVTRTKQQSEDHDLLIVLNNKMDNAIVEIQQMKEGTQNRIMKLENEKIDRSIVLDMKKEADTIHEDHEMRIRAMESRIWLAAGALAALQIGLAIFSALH